MRTTSDVWLATVLTTFFVLIPVCSSSFLIAAPSAAGSRIIVIVHGIGGSRHQAQRRHHGAVFAQPRLDDFDVVGPDIQAQDRTAGPLQHGHPDSAPF